MSTSKASPAHPRSPAVGPCSSALVGAVDDASSDEDEDGFPKQPLGSGVWGRGPPLTSVLMGRKRPFVDGAGRLWTAEMKSRMGA